MQLPDENIEYDFKRLLAPLPEAWTPLAELQAHNFLSADRLEQMKTLLGSIRSRVLAERELANPPAKDLPLQAGFIDLPQKLLDGFRKKGDASDLGKTLKLAAKLKDNCDRAVVLGIGGSYLGAKALFDALCHGYHNELPAKLRMGKPRMYFEGNNLDNDSLQELLELLENVCVEPDLPEERWGLVVISKSGGTLETAAAYRAVRAEQTKYYGQKSEFLKKLCVPITGPKGKLRDLARAEGFGDDDILTIPDDVGGRFSVFTPVGLLPAAVMGLDVRALLLGAAAMTKRFAEEPFERNPVLQFAAVNHLMNVEAHKPTRVLAVWGKKLESVGFWYDQLLSESLGKFGKGATPITSVYTRDLHSRGQQHQDGTRDKVINNLLVKSVKHPAILVGMNDRNEDELNSISRKGFPDLLEAAFVGTNQAYSEAARPTADILLPALTEHTVGQLLQMLMLATVVEGRLAGTNPYGQPGVEAYKKNMMAVLKATPNLPKGEVRDQANPTGGPGTTRIAGGSQGGERMPSPFPGMDPYLERRHYWRGLHAALLVHLQAQLNPLLLPRYRADLEVSMYIDRSGDDERPFAVPDVGVWQPPSGRDAAAGRRRTQAPVVATIRLPRPLRRPRRWLTVRDGQSNRVVAAVELLSPADKRPGKDRIRYLDKRAKYLTSTAALVEIDLLRGWGRMPFDDASPASDYCILISRPDERPEVGLWPFTIRDPFPSAHLPLPGRANEPTLDLRAAFDRAYNGGGFRLDAYRTPPEPPLSPEDAAWAESLIPSGVTSG